jgi:MFS family permease
MSDGIKLFGMKPEGGRWLLIVLGLIINLCLGTVYAYSVFKKPVEHYYNTITAVAVVPEVEQINKDKHGKDLLGKLYGLKEDPANKLKEKHATIDAPFVIEFFKLDPAKDTLKIDAFVTHLKGLSPDKLAVLLSIDKVSSFQSNLPFMIFLAFFAVTMFFGGRIMEKMGPRNLTILGGVIVAAGWFLSGYANNILILVLTYGVIAGSGVGLAYGCPIAVAARWFPDKKGLAVGLTVAGFGGSALLTAKIASKLLDSVGLSTTFMYFGIAFLVIIFLLALPLKFPVAGWKPEGWTPAAGAAAAIDLNAAGMVKTGAYWGVFLCFLIGSLAGLMAIGIAATVGTEVIKIDKAFAATLVSVFAVFNALGRPLFGTITDKLTPRVAAMLNLLLILIASGIMLMAKEGDVALYVGAFILFWMCLGGWLAIAPTSTATFFGIKNYARNYGVVFFAYGIGAILGGLISGKAKDIFGSLQVAFWPTAGLAILGVILAALLIKPPKAA